MRIVSFSSGYVLSSSPRLSSFRLNLYAYKSGTLIIPSSGMGQLFGTTKKTWLFSRILIFFAVLWESFPILNFLIQSSCLQDLSLRSSFIRFIDAPLPSSNFVVPTVPSTFLRIVRSCPDIVDTLSSHRFVFAKSSGAALSWCYLYFLRF